MSFSFHRAPLQRVYRVFPTNQMAGFGSRHLRARSARQSCSVPQVLSKNCSCRNPVKLDDGAVAMATTDINALQQAWHTRLPSLHDPPPSRSNKSNLDLPLSASFRTTSRNPHGRASPASSAYQGRNSNPERRNPPIDIRKSILTGRLTCSEVRRCVRAGSAVNDRQHARRRNCRYAPEHVLIFGARRAGNPDLAWGASRRG